MSRRIRKVKVNKAEHKRHMKKLMAKKFTVPGVNIKEVSAQSGVVYTMPQPGDNYWATTATTTTQWIPYQTTTADWTGNYSQGEWTITTTGS